jgi:hypothetical protein
MVLTWSIWIIYIAVAILYLWRTTRTRGLGVALRGLLTRFTFALLAIEIGRAHV